MKNRDNYTPVTLVMPYYENPGMLDQHYELIRALPHDIRDMLSVIIVDDGSPNSPAMPPQEGLGGVALQIYRLDVDIRWNQHSARNIGAHHAETERMLLTDIDHMVPEKTWRYLMFKKWDRDYVLTFNRVTAPEMSPYKPHPNSWFITRTTFNDAGGYDERFAGYYGTDSDFRHRLERLKDVKVERGKINLIRVPRTHIPDASTTTYLRKQPEDRVEPKRIKAERDAAKLKTKRLTFPYHRVYP